MYLSINVLHKALTFHGTTKPAVVPNKTKQKHTINGTFFAERNTEAISTILSLGSTHTVQHKKPKQKRYVELRAIEHVLSA